MGGIQGLPVSASRRAVSTSGAVLGGGGDVAADGVPVPGGFLGAEPAGDLLLGLGRAQVPLGLVGGGRDAQVEDEPQHVVLRGRGGIPAAPGRRALLAAAGARDLDRPRRTPWRNGVDERGGDLGRGRRPGPGRGRGSRRGSGRAAPRGSGPASARRGRSRRRRPGPGAGELAAKLVGQAGELAS